MDEFLKIILTIFLMCSTAVTLILIYLFYKACKGFVKVKNTFRNITVREAINHTKTAKKTVIRIIRKK